MLGVLGTSTSSTLNVEIVDGVSNPPSSPVSRAGGVSLGGTYYATANAVIPSEWFYEVYINNGSVSEWTEVGSASGVSAPITGYVSSTAAATTLNTGVTSQTWSYNAGTSTANTALIVTAAWNGSGVGPTITYAGISVPQAAGQTSTGSAHVAVFSLAAPATGANNLVMSWGTALSYTGTIGAFVLSGVNQTTPLGTAVSSSSGSAVNVTVPSGGGGIDIASNFAAAPASPTQTQLFSDGTPLQTGASQYTLTSGVQYFGWTGANLELAYPVNPY